MIQDIYPHKLNNQYHPDQKPDADSIILSWQVHLFLSNKRQTLDQL